MATRKEFVSISSRIPLPLRPAVRRLGVAVGELVWASNLAHTALGYLFSAGVKDKDDAFRMLAIWKSLRNDTAQRDVLVAFFEDVNTANARRIIWATTKVGKLSKIRNDAVHMGISFDRDSSGVINRVVPSFGITPEGRYKRLSTTDFIRTFRIAKQDLYRLSLYAFALLEWEGMWRPMTTLPRKPRIRSNLKGL